MYTAAPTSSGSYAISDSTGKQVATGSADILTQYGLSPSNLGGAKNPNDASVGSGTFGQAGTGSASNPSLIVTSGPSRTAYNTSVNNLNTGLANISSPTTTTPSPDGSPVKPNNPQANTTYGTGSESGSVIAQPAQLQTLRTQSGTYTGQDGNLYYNYDGTAANNAPSTGTDTGSGDTSTPGTTTTNADGSSSITLNDGTSVNIPAGTDPGLASEYTQAINTANDTLAQRKADLQSAEATVQNDPAATAALQAISDQYDVLIQQMNNKNSQLLGKASSAVGAFGGLGVMSQNFMSDEMDAANTRISNLVAQEQDLLMKTSIAYKTGDLKALDSAEAAYTQANTAKLTAINDLLSATNKQVAANQAQEKIDAAATKAQNAQDVTNSVKGAAGALTLASTNYGITDPSQLTSDQLNSLATAYGVSNPAILLSQMTSAYAAQQKASLAASNTQSEINTREQNANTSSERASIAATKANAGPKLTAAQTLAQATTKYQSYLQPGVKLKDGTPILDSTDPNGQTITPGAWKQLISQAPADGMTRQQFIKAFGQYVSNPTQNAGEYGLSQADIKLITTIPQTTPTS